MFKLLKSILQIGFSLCLVPHCLAQEEAIQCVAEDQPQPTALRFGSTVSCSLERATDLDVFRFEGRSDEVLVMQLQNGFVANLIDPQGLTTDPFQILTNTTLVNSGTHTIAVFDEGRNNARGNYQFSLDRIVPRSPAAPFICFECTEEGRINPEADLDLFSFRGSPGDKVVIEALVVDRADATANLLLYDPDGIPMPGAAFNLEADLSKEGLYTIQIHDSGRDMTFDYQLKLQCRSGLCMTLPRNCALDGGPIADLGFRSSNAAQVGDLVNFSFKVINHGPAPSERTMLVMPLPEGFFFQNTTQGECHRSDGSLSCDLGTVAVGEIELSISLRIPAGVDEEFPFEVQLSGGQCDPDSQNDRTRAIAELKNDTLADVELIFPQIVDGSEGNLRFQTSLILTNTAVDNPVRVEFRSSPNGSSMQLTLDGFGTGSVFEFEVPRGESAVLKSDGETEGFRVGYAKVQAKEGLGGVLIFARSDVQNSVQLFEAGVPTSQLLTEFSVFVDSMGDRDTGVAIAYPVPNADVAGDAHLTLRLYDDAFELIAEKTEQLPPGGHLARFVHELFDDVGPIDATLTEMIGLLTVSSDQPVAAVTLRQTDAPGKEFPQEVPALTTFPVIASRPVP